LIALLLGLALAELLMPTYNNYLGLNLQIRYNNVYTLVTMFALVLFVGIIGGIYPAFILSGFRPAEILKANKTTNASGRASLSNILVVFQFVVSISLIICAVIIYVQRDHVSNMDLGYDKDHIVILHGVGRRALIPRQQTIQQQIKALPSIISASYIKNQPLRNGGIPTELTVAESDGLRKYKASYKNIDLDYLNI
jgi:putative ABC transport system permease protein